jgi:hypothetical protein
VYFSASSSNALTLSFVWEFVRERAFVYIFWTCQCLKHRFFCCQIPLQYVWYDSSPWIIYFWSLIDIDSNSECFELDSILIFYLNSYPPYELILIYDFTSLILLLPPILTFYSQECWLENCKHSFFYIFWSSTAHRPSQSYLIYYFHTQVSTLSLSALKGRGFLLASILAFYARPKMLTS